MTTSVRKRVAVWQPYFRGGGAEAVALWILEALQDDYDVTLHTLSQVDLTWLNAMYNTNLSDTRISIRYQLPKSIDRIIYSAIAGSEMLRMAFIYWTIKYFKHASSEYDVVLSAFNALDMGRPGIQYLHWVHVVENAYKKAPLWYKTLMQWADFSHARLCENYSIANSEYTAQWVEKTYGIKADVIFPPVVTQIDESAWLERENAFLCSGRIVRAKDTHRVINILKSVREQGFDIKLHITGGGGGGGIYGQHYLRKIEKLVQQNADWISLHQDLSYADYLKVLTRCRYGIHYKPEPFGISVAEMLKADLIPFVRSKGGQMEIVGTEHQDLLFADEKDGVEKIIEVLSNQDLQQNLLQSLQKRKHLFSTEKFMTDIRRTIAKYLASSEKNSSMATLSK